MLKLASSVRCALPRAPLAVRALCSAPTTFANQAILPRLPVPPLSHTCQRYLKSLEPVLLPDQLAATKGFVGEFCKPGGVGENLQQRLEARAKTGSMQNWLEQWWDVAYFGARVPLVITTNPGVILDNLATVASLPEDRRQSWRTAQMMHASMCFLGDLRAGRLPPDPAMCMSQYSRLFGVARQPVHGGCDRLLSFLEPLSGIPSKHPFAEVVREGKEPRHVVVMSKGRVFQVDVVDEAFAPLPVDVLEGKVASILAATKLLAHTPNEAVGVLTAVDRDTWATARTALASAADENKATLEAIERALFVFVLDEAIPANKTELGRLGLCGLPGSRWYDKHMFIVFGNGKAVVNFEHGATDGLTLVTLNKYINKHASATQPSPAPPVVPAAPSPLPWVLSSRLEQVIQSAAASYRLHEQSVDLDVVDFNDFGREDVKRMKCSPDAFFQMALQLAFYRMFGYCVPTYESAATRQFLHGRTETLRSCTSASRAFVEAMDTPKVMTERKRVLQRELLRAATQAHSTNIREATNGQGCDRHLYGLYMIAKEAGMELPPIFTDPAFTYGSTWQLSTSSMPTNEITAFGAVANNGFGVYYCFPNDANAIRFMVSAYHGNNRPAAQFADGVATALRDMAALLNSEAQQ